MNRPARFSVYAAAVAASLLLVWFAVWSPNASAVIEAHDRVDAAALQQGRLSSMLASAQRFADRADGPADLERVNSSVPAEPSLASFLLFIDDAARSTGCVVRGLNPRPAGSIVRAPGGMTGIGVDLVVIGPMDQVQSFLILASRLPRTMLIDEVQINQESDQLVELSIVARIFQTGDPTETAGSPTTTSPDLTDVAR